MGGDVGRAGEEQRGACLREVGGIGAIRWVWDQDGAVEELGMAGSEEPSREELRALLDRIVIISAD